MKRVLDPARIEAFAEREIARVRLPERGEVFARRAARLRHLSVSDRPGEGRAIGDYLKLMTVLVEAQQSALTTFNAPLPSTESLSVARAHGMPPLHAVSLTRDASWQSILGELCGSVLDTGGLPAAVRDSCAQLQDAPAAHREAQADAVLAGRLAEVDTAAAPFLMGALQVYWLELTARLPVDMARPLEAAGVCPVCGTLPIASVVRADKGSYGHRYLHCALCATEWHLVRITCSHCRETKDLSYHSVEGGPPAVSAETCGRCRGYRKIFHQEKDTGVEPVADDLASLALDLLMSAAGYHRLSGNPLLWLTLEAP